MSDEIAAAGGATKAAPAKAGASVIVLEARGVAEAASGRNAGFLLAGVAENFAAASRRYGAANALRIWRLTKRTQALVRQLVAEHGIDCELRWNGSDQLAGDDAEFHEIQESAALLADHVNVRLDGTRRGATYSDDGDLHPVKWVRGLARAAASAGARIHESSAVTAVADGKVDTARGTVS